MNNVTTQNETSVCAPEAPANRRFVVPRYTVLENAEAFVVTADVPGVDRSAIETTLDADRLTVTARRTWTKPEGWTPVHRETAQADFRLGFELDHRIDRERIEARLEHGVLTLTLRKAEALKPRKIEISG